MENIWLEIQGSSVEEVGLALRRAWKCALEEHAV